MAQPLQNITVAAPGFLGLNTQDSPIGLNPSFASIANNCVIDQYGRIGARKGYVNVSTNGATVLGSEEIEAIHEFVDRDGSITVFSAGNNKIFTGTTLLSEVTLPAGYTITANNWKIITFNNNALFFQRGHEPLKSNAGSTTLEVLADSAHIGPSANEVLGAFGRLWAADITDNKYTIYYSKTLDVDNWHSGGAGSLDLTSVWPTGFDEIVGLAAYNSFLVIFGKRSILVYEGASMINVAAPVFKLHDTVEGVGCISRDSIQQTGNDIIFLSETGIRSFGRTIQEKSMPLRDISKNVRNDLTGYVSSELASSTGSIDSVYSADEAFYLLALKETGITYCVDMRGPLDESGAHRITTWSANTPTALTRLADGSVYMGKNQEIVNYSGYLDNGNVYSLDYFSNPMDFQSPANLKFLKKFNLTIIGSTTTPVTLNWGYDYTTSFRKQALVISEDQETTPAEFTVSEYNTDAEYSSGISITTPKLNTTGSGSVVTIGIEADITSEPFSIQKIDIHALLGRLI